MLLETIIVGLNTYMGVSRAYDEAMAAPSSVSRALLDPFLRGVTFLATKDLDEILANKANQQCHLKTYRALDRHVSTGIVMGADLQMYEKCSTNEIRNRRSAMWPVGENISKSCAGTRIAVQYTYGYRLRGTFQIVYYKSITCADGGGEFFKKLNSAIINLTRIINTKI